MALPTLPVGDAACGLGTLVGEDALLGEPVFEGDLKEIKHLKHHRTLTYFIFFQLLNFKGYSRNSQINNGSITSVPDNFSGQLVFTKRF